MITDLHISNYALIDSIDITFGEGLNIITGETGAGKSIILGALGLLLGARADSKVIRHPDEKSVVEATFTVTDSDVSLIEQLKTAEIEFSNSDGCLVLRRELSANGRNRAFVNDSLVTLSQLQQIASLLIDIHSQHQNALLANQNWQLQLIDSLAQNQKLNERFSELYNAYRHALRRYRQERTMLDQAREEEEFLRYQFSQLNEANLQVGEVEQLETELRRLENAAALGEALTSIRRILADDDSGATAAISIASNSAAKVSEMLADEASAALEQRLDILRIELSDITDAYESIAESLDAEPGRLAIVEERLNLLYTLLRRHKVDTTDELIEIRDKMGERLRAVDLGEETLRTLEVEAKRAKKSALQCAAELTERRKAQASTLAEALAKQARPLGMENLKVEIAITQTPLTATGCDAVEFLFAFNKNQPLTTIASSASGGEISRLMLAIKSLAAKALQMPVIVFDEVDTGVSGAIAARMGNLMKEISEKIQVIAITHLPQVAALGKHHFSVYKHDTESATLTSVTKLKPEQRVAELAKMLSGSDVDVAAIANARALLGI